ncbi:MAG: aminodeoxychorismate synthase component I [Thermoleophilia bacterium]|nr:aminodeoxychorismate synthase component I [Thermoleophilia bacterium]
MTIPNLQVELPRSPGTVILPGGGTWLRRDSCALVLSSPQRVLTAATPEEVPLVLDQVESEQEAGRYVAGYLAYEAGAAFGLKVRASEASNSLPLAWFAVYQPHDAKTIPPETWQRLLKTRDLQSLIPSMEEAGLALNVTRDEYTEAIARVREYIAAGDTYQINYTVRGRFFLGQRPIGPAERPTDTGQRPMDPLDYFLALLGRQPVPYAAYLDLGEAQIISLSPEMFLRREGRVLESKPMKGTRPRGASHTEDVAFAYELAQLEKERAENLMIVDMVRNDLGRVCRAGSVHVPALYVLEPYRTVWQMVSTVTGEVNPRASLRDIIAAVFPGASITGAPKYHTMELIAELETERRGVYTGAIGLFQPGGDFTLSIAIRTIVHRKGHCLLGVGSGVVWDAVASAEFEETLTKASFAFAPSKRDEHTRQGTSTAIAHDSSHAPSDEPFHEPFYLFETLLLQGTDGATAAELGQTGLGHKLSPPLTRYLFLEDHLARMAASARDFGLSFDQDRALELLADHAARQQKPEVVRLVLGEDGSLELVPRPFSPPPESAILLVSPIRTDPDDLYLRHKTSRRGFYNREHRRAIDQGCFDALFINRLDRVTEGAITNIFARFGERWVTPPVSDGLLPGIWRAYFLKQTGAEEASLLLDDLLRADELVVGNSVRGAVRVSRLVVDPIKF